MAEILRWTNIAQRLGCSIPTARRLFEEEGLLCYRKNRPHGRQRWTWATSDELIQAWRIAKARVDHADALAAREIGRAHV